MRANRIALITSSLSAGGAERVMSEMANYWADQGHDVTVLTIASSDQDHYHLSSRVQRVGLDLLGESRSPLQTVANNIIRLRRIRGAIRALRSDVVISFIDQTNVRVLAALLGAGIPVIISERVDPRWHSIGPAWDILRRVLYPVADAVVVQTDKVKRWALRMVAAHRVRVIPNPVRQVSFEPGAVLDPEAGEKRTIVAIGRLDPQKGFDLLIEAFAKSSVAELGWRLVILGEGSERSRLEELRRTNKLEDRVELPGVVEDPFVWLRGAGLFVLSSRYEGFPNALLEAMACGTPAIAFDCESGPAEIIRDGVDGFLVPAGDVSALANVMLRLIKNKDERRRLGSRATEVNQRFSREVVMGLWDGLIDEVLKKRTER